jgi:ribosomal peptide maturation radical SAM protein 1
MKETARRQGSAQPDVILVNMPFAEVQRPSIALGLLQAALAGTPIGCAAVYANFDFAEAIGLVAYEAMQSAPTDHLLGEWCFAGLLFPECPQRDEEYLNLVLEVRYQTFPASLERRKELARWVRAQSTHHIERVARRIVARGPRIVGCSSVFQQHCASLALLKRVRELSPETVLVMGGANCEVEMGVETLRAFPWLDCVVSGEADGTFADLCRALLDSGRGVEPSRLPGGVTSQAHLRAVFPMEPARPVLRDMDALPVPDYDDYFAALKASTLSELVQPELLAESSRGCWWGEKSHCTFCGLNGAGMQHRSKSPERLLTELAELAGRYGRRRIQFVDNILDMSYFRTVLPKLAASAERYELFFEVKSNLKRDEVRLLAEAGVRWIQPGIESLDDNVLRLVGKGNSALMNLQLLKWSREFGIDSAWNMLCGLPGESDQWYAAMVRWLPAVFHLQPPSGLNRVRYDRFSPYHMRPGDFGLRLRPSRAYAYVYPLPEKSLMRLAYSFEDLDDAGHVHRGVHSQPGQSALQDVLAEWNRLWRGARPELRVSAEDKRLKVYDTRPGAPCGTWLCSELEARVYRLCDTAAMPASLAKQIPEAPPEEVRRAIQSLCAAGLVLPLNGKLLGIGVWSGQESERSACERLLSASSRHS